jgi:hypothetical protein
LTLHKTFERNASALVHKLIRVDNGEMSWTKCELDLLRGIENDFLKGIFHFPCMHVCEESGKACQIAFRSPLDLLKHQKEHIKIESVHGISIHSIFSDTPKLRRPLQCLLVDMEAGGVCLHQCKDEQELWVHRSEHVNGIPLPDLGKPSRLRRGDCTCGGCVCV